MLPQFAVEVDEASFLVRHLLIDDLRLQMNRIVDKNGVDESNVVEAVQGNDIVVIGEVLS